MQIHGVLFWLTTLAPGNTVSLYLTQYVDILSSWLTETEVKTTSGQCRGEMMANKGASSMMVQGLLFWIEGMMDN